MRLVSCECVGLQNGMETVDWVSNAIPRGEELFEVNGDLTFMPGEKDGLDIGEVFVQRRSPDTGGLRDAGHCHRKETVFGDQHGGCGQDRIVDFASVGFDRLGPELWHGPSIRADAYRTVRLDSDSMY